MSGSIPSPGAGEGGLAWSRILRKFLGCLLLFLCLVPVYRLLDPSRVGPFGEAAVIQGSANLGLTYWGAVVALALGLLLSTVLPASRLRSALGTASLALSGIRGAFWAVGLGIFSVLLTLAASAALFRGLPTSVDGMASLLQARFMAHGAVAGPVPEHPASVLILNTILTPEGWVSLYPPSHLLLVAAGFALGGVWLVGPILTGLTVTGTALAAEHLLPGKVLEARVGTLLFAISPFVLFLGSGYLSHVSATCFLVWTLVVSLRARDGGWGWAVPAGILIGLAVTSRPWIGVVLGTAFTGGIWLVHLREGARSWRWLWARAAAVVAGGLPLALLWFAYNAHVFGDPLTLGYSYAYGAPHGLGFHPDPWGNLYTIREAVGYTSANILALGINFLESPLSVVLLVAAWLIVADRVPRGTGILLAWAMLPMAANLFYWHHGFHLGPRMLYESTPAWAALTALSIVSLAGIGSGDRAALPTDDSTPGLPGSLTLRNVLLSAFLVTGVAIPILAVQRGLNYRHSDDALARFDAPVPDTEPAVVFVHGSWAERLSARLQGDGMTLDSIETVLRRNDICLMQAYVTDRVEGSMPTSRLPVLDAEPLPGIPDGLRSVPLSDGNRVWVDPDRPFRPRCAREARSDRNGVVALAPLVWQGDLPGISEGRPLFVRDLGWDENRRILELHPTRTAYLYASREPGTLPELLSYREGMALLWGREPEPSDSSSTTQGR